MNGRPSRSSASPGCSPSRTIFALRGPSPKTLLRRVLVKRTCFTGVRGSLQDVPAGRGRWFRRPHSHNSYGRMAEAGTFHCANPAHSTLRFWEPWRISHVSKGAVFILNGFAAERSRVRVRRSGGNIAATRRESFMAMSSNTFIPTPIKQVSERRLHGGRTGKRRITPASSRSQNI